MARTPRSDFPTWKWAFVGAQADSVADAWSLFVDELRSVGFEVSALIYNVRPETVFPAESQLYGSLISNQYVEYCRRPQAGDVRFRVPEASQAGQRTLIEPERLLEQRPISETERAIVELMIDFGLKCGWTTPVPDPVAGHYSVLALSELADPRDFHRRLQHYGGAISRATIHLIEGLSVRAVARDAGQDLLTPRESDCLAWTSAGLSSKLIAERLGISVTTVDEHLASAQRRLRCNNRTQAVARALLLGCVKP